MAIQELSTREIMDRIHATVLSGSVFVKKSDSYNCYPAPYDVKIVVTNNEKFYTATIYIHSHNPDKPNEVFDIKFKNLLQLNTELYVLYDKLRANKINLAGKYNLLINGMLKNTNGTEDLVTDPVQVAHRLEGVYLYNKQPEYLAASRYCLFINDALKHINKINKRSAAKCSS